MKSLFTLLLLFSTASFAHDLDIKLYLKVQEALASDDFKTALVAHKYICDNELLQYKEDSYKNCNQNFKDIDELRTSFKLLSEFYLENGNKKDLIKYEKASCPMAKAKWIQKPGRLRNPYYGKSMLDCGEKI